MYEHSCGNFIRYAAMMNDTTRFTNDYNQFRPCKTFPSHVWLEFPHLLLDGSCLYMIKVVRNAWSTDFKRIQTSPRLHCNMISFMIIMLSFHTVNMYFEEEDRAIRPISHGASRRCNRSILPFYTKQRRAARLAKWKITVVIHCSLGSVKLIEPFRLGILIFTGIHKLSFQNFVMINFEYLTFALHRVDSHDVME